VGSMRGGGRSLWNARMQRERREKRRMD